jgi:hypothetical protein
MLWHEIKYLHVHRHLLLCRQRGQIIPNIKDAQALLAFLKK